MFCSDPSYVLRDDKAVNHYDITIRRAKSPLSVVVIGKWQQEDEQIRSDSILLKVNAAAAL